MFAQVWDTYYWTPEVIVRLKDIGPNAANDQGFFIVDILKETADDRVWLFKNIEEAFRIYVDPEVESEQEKAEFIF